MAIIRANGQVEFKGMVVGTFTPKAEILMMPVAEVWTGTEVITKQTFFRETVEVDATPEIMEQAKKWKEAKKAALEQVEWARLILERNSKLQRGNRVEVIAGRKIKKGTTGFIFWIGETKYGMSVGLEIDGTKERQFTSPGNVNKVLTAEEEKKLEEANKILDNAKPYMA